MKTMGRKSIFLLITRVALLLSSIYTLPTTNAAYLALTNSIPKCVVVETSSPIEFEVEYESPDIRIIDDEYEQERDRILEDKAKRDGRHLDEMKQKQQQQQQKKKKDSLEDQAEGGERFRRALDNLVNMHDTMGSTQMTISEFDKGAKSRRHGKNYAISKRKVENTVLKKREGKVRFQMVQCNAARVCIQTYGASTSKPTFVHLQIRELSKYEYEQQPLIDDEKIQEEKKEEMAINTHMKYLEGEIGRLIHTTNVLVKAIPRMQDSHSLLHTNLVKLHTTIKWMNIFHTCSILITALSCVSLLKGHFKKLKIIF